MLKKLMVSLLILSLVFLAACEGSKEGDDEDNLTLEQYLQQVKLPNNLEIAIDPETVVSAQEARIHEAGYWELDPETVSKHLLRGELVEMQPMAEGPWYHASGDTYDEYLSVYDNGKSAGIDESSAGGMSYVVHEKSENEKPLLIVDHPDPLPLSSQGKRSMAKSDYSSYADLTFMPYEEALAEVLEHMKQMGFPELAVSETYSMDVETQRKHYEYYVEERGIDPEFGPEDWTTADEKYIFFLRQVIDEIPVTHSSWTWGQGTGVGPAGNWMQSTWISAVYSPDGLQKMYAANMYRIKEELASEAMPVVSPVHALRTMIDEYSDLILEEKLTTTSMELVYVSVPKGKETFELIPAWMITIAEPYESDHSDEDSIKYNYRQYVVHAITGEKISGSR